MQDCSNSIANALELLQSCTKPSIRYSGGVDKGDHLTPIFIMCTYRSVLCCMIPFDIVDFPCFLSSFTWKRALYWGSSRHGNIRRASVDCSWLARAYLQVNIELTRRNLNNMADIVQTTFSNAFSCKKMFEFWLKFHWSLFLGVQLAVSQHFVR